MDMKRLGCQHLKRVVDVKSPYQFGIKPWEACETELGTELEVIHVERIKAAAERDAAVTRERRPTSLYEIESREADEKPARMRKRKIRTKR